MNGDRTLEPNRAQTRSSLFLAAVLRSGSQQSPVKVRNMSLNGAMIESPFTPPVGAVVQLIRGSLRADGKVMWSSSDRCGLRFDKEIAIKQWLAPPSKAQQERVDEIVSLVRAGAVPATLSAHDRARAPREEELIDGLNEVVRLLEDLENDLCTSQESLARHGPKLQNLDIALQMIKAVVRGLNGEEHTQGAELSDLRLVCEQALAGK
jgi:hypothetical protein